MMLITTIVAGALSTIAFASAAGQAASPDTATRDDVGALRGLRYGVAAGALSYDGGRSEQTFGGVIRWAPVHFFSLAANPTLVRQHVAGATATATSAASRSASRSGLADIPISASISHVFSTVLEPVVVGGLDMTVPVGDTVAGFGAGQAGYSVSIGVTLSPSDQTWTQFGLGHALSDFSPQSAFTAGSNWMNAGAGLYLTDRLSIDGDYSTDVGGIDAIPGRSSSVSAGVELSLVEGASINLAASRGLSGVAPSWSFSLGFGTALPSLGQAESGLTAAFGGGTHGLGRLKNGKRGRGGRKG
jgi:hypothetical protein